MRKILIDEATGKLALEALDVATTPFARDRQEVLRAQAALREALADQRAQQEFVSPGGGYVHAIPAQQRPIKTFHGGKAWPVQEPAQQDSTCSNALRIQDKAYPRTCKKCGLGPCIELAQQALDKMAENARELGLNYEPVQHKPMHPEIKKMYEDYFDKCFRESSAAVPENFMDALKFDVAMREAVEAEREACAKVCDDYDDEYDVHTRQTVEGIALQIRARSNT